ncbi:SIR2 family protein [Rhodocista pekingensis]|uniref:SIR2 family protein n=1 Tax=Rhodocista pekingensis TaxID=201185 RepID=A0ABW2KWW1_9PROT
MVGSGEAVAFVGAGASAGLYPLWGQFIDQLADHAVEVGKAEPKDAERWKRNNGSTPQQRVNAILRKLGDDRYRQFLKSTFGPKRGADGKRFTPVHAALMTRPFKGFVTTNYDPALDFARQEFRKECLTTGTPTWEDEGEIHRWYTGEVFQDECPILWLHGYWQKPGGTVLNARDYAAAYRPGLYKRVFEKLWGQDRLVFAGFGFNDPQFTFMVGELLRDFRDAHALPRHIALLGWPLKEGETIDPDDVRDRREAFEQDYHVRPLFYPAPNGGRDHSALLTLLDALAAREPPKPPTQATAAVPTLYQHWVHAASDDDRFTGRGEEMVRLDRWVKDPRVRAVALCAVGGTGKTALIGHWLKHTAGWQSRPFAGLFAWSFYQDRDTGNLLTAFLDWTHKTFGSPAPTGDRDLAREACRRLAERPLVLVLDGLEVVQEGEEEAHGRFLDGLLRDFLTRACRDDHSSLIVLTSRFTLADLTRFLGLSFQQLELPGLTPDQGADLLGSMKVDGTAEERREVSAALQGHPLGLRVFADAIPSDLRDTPRRFLDQVFTPGTTAPGAPLAEKLRRLLGFYERRLSPTQVRLLGVVALFRTPVAEATVLRIARGLFGEDAEAPLPADSALRTTLSRLQLDGVLTREPMADGAGYAAHPVLRDHFRGVLIGSGAAGRAADLLSGAPSDDRPRTLAAVEPVLLAIDLLQAAGDFRAADALYRGRLENGQLLKWIAAPQAKRAVARGFVGDAERQGRCAEQLGEIRLAFYWNALGFAAGYLGDLHEGAAAINKANDIDRQRKDWKRLSNGLQNACSIQVDLGNLQGAFKKSGEALRHAEKVSDDREVRNSAAYVGFTAALLAKDGRLRQGLIEFSRANVLEIAIGYSMHGLYSLRGTRWVDVMLRGGQPDVVETAVARLRDNRAISDRNSWDNDAARYDRLLAEASRLQDRPGEAASPLAVAEGVFRRGMLVELARLHVTAGRVDLALSRLDDALARAEEALSIAAPREMRLIQADALILRGQVRLALGDQDRAVDDGEAALRIALDCSYGWGERDAWRLLAQSLPPGPRQRAAKAEADALDAELTITMADLDAADAEAQIWLKEWQARNREDEPEADEAG